MTAQKKVVLIGMPGSGKTTVGQELARRADIPFFDSDAILEETLHLSIASLIDSKGEAYFRHKEAVVISRLLRPFYGVLATGGGSVLDQKNRPLFAIHGVVYLRATPEVLAKRLENVEDRPLLKGNGSLIENIKTTLEIRQSIYESLAHFIIDIDPLKPTEIVEAISTHFGLVLDDEPAIIIET